MTTRVPALTGRTLSVRVMSSSCLAYVVSLGCLGIARAILKLRMFGHLNHCMFETLNV